MVHIIYSDVHSNLEAMRAFLELADTIPHDRKACLGDIVGYGPDPNPCIGLIRETTDLVLAGNHDFAVLNKTDISSFNDPAREACIWAREQLTEESVEFLDSLPVKRQQNGICWVHSSPFEPEKWHYIYSQYQGEINFDYFDTQFCFVGHTHVPLILGKAPDGAIKMIAPSKIKLSPENRYIINVGSLGQPRDNNPDPAFVVFDSQALNAEFRRFSYDRPATQQKIIHNGLPIYLAERLSHGQ